MSFNSIHKLLMLLAAVAVCSANFLLAQPELEWHYSYGYENTYHSCTSAIPAHNGGFILVGGVDSRIAEYNIDDRDNCAVKVYENGEMEWIRHYGVALSDSEYYFEMTYEICSTSDGNYILAGTSNASFEREGVFGNAQVNLLKIDDAGDLLWNRKYCLGDRRSYATGIIECEQDGYFVVGGASSEERLNSDGYLLKINSEGDSLWTVFFGGDYRDDIYNIIAIDENEFLLGGFTAELGLGRPSIYLVKINSQGEELQSNIIGTDDLDTPTSMIKTSDGGFALTARRGNFNDILFIRTDADLEPVSMVVWDEDRPFCMAEDIIENNDGSFVLAGNSIPENDFFPLLLLKIDEDGNEVWSAHYGEREFSYFSSRLFLTDDNSYYIAGGGDFFRFTLMKTEPDFTNVSDLKDYSPYKFILFPAYPNPFNSATIIRYYIPSTTHVKFALFEINGKEISVLQQGINQAGFNTIEFNSGSLPSGIYILRMNTENTFSQSIKLLLMK